MADSKRSQDIARHRRARTSRLMRELRARRVRCLKGVFSQIFSSYFFFKKNLQKLGDEICPNVDQRSGGSNQRDSSTFVISRNNKLASQPSLQLNSTQSMCIRRTSTNIFQAFNQNIHVSPETQGKILNSLKASFKPYSLLGNNSNDPPSCISSNLGSLVISSTSARHVGTTKPHGNAKEDVQDLPVGDKPPETPANPHMPLLGSPGSPMPRCATAFSEQREASSVKDFPEELRAHALATPEHFHAIILRAYNKPPRRLRDIRRRHVRFNPPSGCNLGENLLWLLECAAAGTPIFEVGPSWISKGGRGVFRTKYCVRLPKSFRIPLHGHFPSAPATTEEEADAIFMGQPILKFWGGPDNAFICSRDSGGPAVLGHLMNTPVRGCRKGDTTYLARVTPEGLASNQDLCQANCSLVNNPHWPQVRVRDSYTAPRSSDYGMVREMLVGYGNAYDV